MAASANVVEIQIQGKDLSSAAFKTATASTQKLGAEMKSVGSAMNAAGNVASVLGATHFANLTNQATLLAFAGKEVIQVFSKMNLVKASIAGLALAGGAMLVNQVMKEREERKKATEDLEEYHKKIGEVIFKIQELGSAEVAQLQAEKAHHIERIRAVQELAISQEEKNHFIMTSHELMERTQTRISEEQTRRREQLAEQEKQKKRAIQNTIVSETSQAFGNMAAAALAFGKKGFSAYKAFATAQAIVDTYKAANAAYSAMAGIPIIGPALGIAAAAAAIAAGIANVAQIQAQQPQAHSGLDYVPQDATYKLKKGEMILDEGTSDVVRGNASSMGGGDMYLDGIKITRWINEQLMNGKIRVPQRALVA